MFHLRLFILAGCIILSSLIPFGTTAAELSNLEERNSALIVVNKKIEQLKREETTAKRQQITAEAIAAINETSKALKALDKGKKDETLAALERATGKLELILARSPISH